MQALLDADSRTRHGKFGDVISSVRKEQLSDYEICSKQLASIIDIGNSMKHQLHQLIEWFKSLGIFNELCLDDQACHTNNRLLSNSEALALLGFVSSFNLAMAWSYSTQLETTSLN